MEFIMNGKIHFHLIKNLCTIQTFLRLLVTAETATAPEWISKPGKLHVLKGTKLVLNWTHAIQPPLDITWDYKGTDIQPVLDLIMDYTTGAGIYIPIQDQWYGRVGYDQSIAGSAIMTLDNVTSADEKYYEVNVKNLDDQRYSLVGQTSILVVPDKDINTSLTIANRTFQLSLVENGTRVLLPEEVMISPAHIRIAVAVHNEAPKPCNIDIEYTANGIVYNKHSCESSYGCERYIHFNVNHTHAGLAINITFNVQNLGPIVFDQMFKPNRLPNTKPARNTYGIIASIASAVAFAILIASSIAGYIINRLKKEQASQHQGHGKEHCSSTSAQTPEFRPCSTGIHDANESWHNLKTNQDSGISTSPAARIDTWDRGVSEETMPGSCLQIHEHDRCLSSSSTSHGPVQCQDLCESRHPLMNGVDKVSTTSEDSIYWDCEESSVKTIPL